MAQKSFPEKVSTEPFSDVPHQSPVSVTEVEVLKSVRPSEEGHYVKPVPAQSGSNKATQVSGLSRAVATTPVNGPCQPRYRNGCGVFGGLEEEGDPKESTIVAINWPIGRSTYSPDPPEDQRPKCRNCGLKCLKVSTIVSGLCTAVFVSLFMITILLKEQYQQLKPSRTLELLEGDTLLAYQDMLPVQFAATIEKGDSTQFNMSLISVDCQELEIHELQLRIKNLSVTFYTDYPIKLPPGYQHFELGSLFIYNISLIDASNISELTMRIFSNTLDAEQYISDHTNQSTQSKSVFYQTFKGNEPSSVVFHPRLASYYIPTFVAPAETTVNISYFVSKKYYLFSDYIETYENQCELNPTETPCYFENSNNTEICVIAHYARTSTSAARILLAASNTMELTEYVFPLPIKILSLLIFIVCAFAFALIFSYCSYKCCKNCRVSQSGYLSLEDHT